MESLNDTTDKLIELSATQAAKGLRVSSIATQKLAMRTANLQTIPEEITCILQLIEPTETAMAQTQHMMRQAQTQEEFKALQHKAAMLGAMLKRIENTLDCC